MFSYRKLKHQCPPNYRRCRCYVTIDYFLTIRQRHSLLNVISQLTGEISHLKLAILKEGFGLSNSEADVDELVRNAADRLRRETGATVEEVSVKMHLDGI